MIMAKKAILAVVAVVISSLAAARSPMPDILMEKEETGNDIQSNSIGRILSGPMDMFGDVPCQMDLRLTKRVTGKCVKLGPGAEGCVAGSYVHPFHQDCMFSR